LVASIGASCTLVLIVDEPSAGQWQ
jgi:hypothetical protein